MISLEHKLDRFQGGCLVMGDFNEDIQILFHEDYGRKVFFNVWESTTENGTLIDHVYVRQADHVKVDVLQTY